MLTNTIVEICSMRLTTALRRPKCYIRHYLKSSVLSKLYARIKIIAWTQQADYTLKLETSLKNTNSNKEMSRSSHSLHLGF